MQQILKFKIEVFDVRMRTSIAIVDDTALVRAIQINKNTALDNNAVITFVKSKTYELLALEGILKLFNYVKIELELKEYNPSNLKPDKNGVLKGEIFYFSGFIQTINKNATFGETPTAAVTITVSDYANLLKTTFYTKNLTFLEILNQAVPEFRLINLTEYLGASTEKLLNGFYSPAQLGFVFFAFLYFKFMYKLIYDIDENGKASDKKTASPDSRLIFKKFKIYTPFNLSIALEDSFLKGQEQTITIYKQLQGVALDLFKYIYPEPIFEFSTYETKDSVILMIRFTPLMKFDRPLLPPKNISFGPGDFLGSFQEKPLQTQGFEFSPDSYNVIDRFDFGHKKIRGMREFYGVSPAQILKGHLEGLDTPEPRKLITLLNESIGKTTGLAIEDLIANDAEADDITDKFFNEITMNSDYIESLNMTRSASSVVNVIWTTPTTDTTLLKMSGREMIYAFLEQRLIEEGGIDKFGNYIYRQFTKDFNPNPAFLMDYRQVFGQDFISGDMNYFGFREFEVKWNYLSLDYNVVSYILSRVDRNVLKECKEKSKDKVATRYYDEALQGSTTAVSKSSTAKQNPRRTTTPIFDTSSLTEQFLPPSILATGGAKGKISSLAPYVQLNFFQTSRAANLNKKTSKNKALEVKSAISDEQFKKAMIRYKLKEEDLKNVDAISKLVLDAKRKDEKLMGGFVSELNSVISEAYRENEHLYECSILRPITLSILPGMIVKSTSNSIKGKSPFIKGYATAVSHSIDFNASKMKTSMTISRAASDDSGVVASFTGDFTP